MADIRAAIQATVAGSDKFTASPSNDTLMRSEDQAPASDPYADETKWPVWKVTLAIVAFCGAFWTGVIYLILKLLG